MTTDLLDAALAYAKNNWFIFPIHTPHGALCSCQELECENIGKHPRTYHGHKDATTDPTVIRQWWTKWVDANIGVDCGRTGLAVIDVDADKGGYETWNAFVVKHNLSQTTLMSRTGGGGMHVIYKAPPGLIIKNENNGRHIGPGVDVKASGGYIVLPPSIHLSGNKYEWINA